MFPFYNRCFANSGAKGYLDNCQRNVLIFYNINFLKTPPFFVNSTASTLIVRGEDEELLEKTKNSK